AKIAVGLGGKAIGRTRVVGGLRRQGGGGLKGRSGGSRQRTKDDKKSDADPILSHTYPRTFRRLGERRDKPSIVKFWCFSALKIAREFRDIPPSSRSAKALSFSP